MSLSLPVISLHRPSCSFFDFLVLCLPFMPPSLHLHFSFLSPSFPFHCVSFHFPVLSCHVHFLSPACPPVYVPFMSPLFSLHFPCISPSPVFFRKEHCSFQRFQKGVQQHRVVPGFRQNEATRAPVFDVSGGGTRGGGHPLSSLRCPTRRAISADTATNGPKQPG